jgi:hypothetical protein
LFTTIANNEHRSRSCRYVGSPQGINNYRYPKQNPKREVTKKHFRKNVKNLVRNPELLARIEEKPEFVNPITWTPELVQKINCSPPMRSQGDRYGSLPTTKGLNHVIAWASVDLTRLDESKDKIFRQLFHDLQSPSLKKFGSLIFGYILNDD